MPQREKFYQRDCFSGILIGLMLLLFFVVIYRLDSQRSSPSEQKSPLAVKQPDHELVPKLKNQLLFITIGLNSQYHLVSFDKDTEEISGEVRFSLDRPITNTAGLAKDGTIYLVTKGQEEFQGSLYELKPSGNVSLVLDSLVFTSPPSLSPDAQNIVYTTFSNAESDFGFRVIELNLNTKEKKPIAKNQAGLAMPKFCYHSKICYVRQTDKGTSEIVAYDTTNQTEEIQLKSDRPLVDFSVTEDALVLLDRGDSSDQILVLQGKDPQKVEAPAGYKRQVHLSDDRQSITYLWLTKTNDLTGKMIVLDRRTGSVSSINDKVAFIVGWRPK